MITQIHWETIGGKTIIGSQVYNFQFQMTKCIALWYLVQDKPWTARPKWKVPIRFCSIIHECIPFYLSAQGVTCTYWGFCEVHISMSFASSKCLLRDERDGFKSKQILTSTSCIFPKILVVWICSSSSKLFCKFLDSLFVFSTWSWLSLDLNVIQIWYLNMRSMMQSNSIVWIS